MRSLKRGLALTAAVAALGAGTLGTASAATANPADSKARTATTSRVADEIRLPAAPGCISAWRSGNKAYAYNGCDGQHRIKFIWAFAPDSNCFTIRPGETWSHTKPSGIARFDGLRSC
ncbi:hypothetical protein [Streptomyces sp. NPDC020965]|uniref:hypothetical protein n=1 Tax=Streptomyces sp. NPDC020965 TaxID=3365105 RepID=UPI0037942E52